MRIGRWLAGRPLSFGRGSTAVATARNGRSPARRVEIRVELKPGVVDAEADSIQRSLAQLGIRSVAHVRTARVYDLEFTGVGSDEAERRAGEAVDRLLANPVIHRVTIRPVTD